VPGRDLASGQRVDREVEQWAFAGDGLVDRLRGAVIARDRDEQRVVARLDDPADDIERAFSEDGQRRRRGRWIS
jgi:hypothetical protein